MQQNFKLSTKNWELLFNNLYEKNSNFLLGNNRLFVNDMTSLYFVNHEPHATTLLKNYFIKNHNEINQLIDFYNQLIYSKENYDAANILREKLVKDYAQTLKDINIYDISAQFLSELGLTYGANKNKTSLNHFSFFKLLEKDGLNVENFLDNYAQKTIERKEGVLNFLDFYVSWYSKNKKEVPESITLNLMTNLDNSLYRKFSKSDLEHRLSCLEHLNKSSSSLDYLLGLIEKNNSVSFYNLIKKQSNKYPTSLLHNFSNILIKNSVQCDIVDSYTTTLKIDTVSIVENKNFSSTHANNFLICFGYALNSFIQNKYPFATMQDSNKEAFNIVTNTLQDRDTIKSFLAQIKDTIGGALDCYEKNKSPNQNKDNIEKFLNKISLNMSLQVSLDEKSNTKKSKKI